MGFKRRVPSCRMRIAQIAPIVERLPPRKYGGTERVVYHLTEELVKKGHDVTLFATGDTVTSAKLVSVVPRGLREMKGEKDIYGFNLHSLLNMGLAYSMAAEFDIIHDHNAHMGLPTANVVSTNVVMTWHGPYDAGMTEYFSRLSRPHLVSISRSQAALAPSLRFAGTVYNGLPMEHYPFAGSAADYLLFVGRIDMEKGVHFAIDAAVATETRLIIAAKLDDAVPAIKKYFDEYIAPRLAKHADLVTWIGEVDEAERNQLMTRARALLHAVTWPEPFGLTLIEAQACGCPVIAFNKGAIPEIVRDGATGYVVEDLAGMIRAIKDLPKIDRAQCRAHALENFNATRMAEGYEAIYRRVLRARVSPHVPRIVRFA